MYKEWNSLADDWDNSMKEGDWFQRYIIYPELMHLCGCVKGKKLIDIGCGNGHLSRFFHLQGADVWGIDNSRQMIDRCRSYGTDITFTCCDITASIPPDLQDFDFAVFNNSLQDMPHFEEGLRNAHALLKQNGALVIAVKHPCFHPNRTEHGWKIRTADQRTFTTGQGLTNLALNERDYSGEYFMMDHYLSEDVHIREWYGKETTSYARTLQEYINTIIRSGFTLKGVYEPAPVPEGEKENPCLFELLQRIPNFIFIHAVKGELR